MRQLRIGIDVGGTFTHAVALDNRTLEVVAHQVAPTTHTHPQGVAAGIIEVCHKLQERLESQDKIVFLAHSTTQATNALLEGDVAKVGIVGLAGALEALKVKGDLSLGRIELTPGKFLETESIILDPQEEGFEERLREQLKKMQGRGVGAVVAAQAFSVDDPQGEDEVERVAREVGLPACATHQMSGLYGLGARTQTAVFNASILPKMMETALMTEKALQEGGLEAPLMVMRSDGGVMSLEEMRRRPVWTLLSGPAAGIAACLMFLKASDALFLEVGGTSTDICLVKDGRAAVRSASIGGRKTYLHTLDSRTLGVAGGSMVGLEGERLALGPRSAHLAGYPYASFAPEGELIEASELQMQQVSPFAGDHAYWVVVGPEGRKWALTTTCAANRLGLIPLQGYSRGNRAQVREAFSALARELAQRGLKPRWAEYRRWLEAQSALDNSLGEEGPPQELPSGDWEQLGRAWAWEVLEEASRQVLPTLEGLKREYHLEGRKIKLLGGGGGAGAIVPYLAERWGAPWEIAQRAEVISAIGAALAMVRESLERNIMDPTPADIQALRQQAEEAVLKMGADPQSIEVRIEIEAQKNILRAIAQGSIEFSNRQVQELSPAERLQTLQAAGPPESQYQYLGSSGYYHLYQGEVVHKRLWGLWKSVERTLWLTDPSGSVRLQAPGASWEKGRVAELMPLLEGILERYTSYGDAGALVPALHLVAGHKLCDLSSLVKGEQIKELARAEVEGLEGATPLLILIKRA